MCTPSGWCLSELWKNPDTCLPLSSVSKLSRPLERGNNLGRVQINPALAISCSKPPSRLAPMGTSREPPGWDGRIRTEGAAPQGGHCVSQDLSLLKCKNSSLTGVQGIPAGLVASHPHPPPSGLGPIYSSIFKLQV